MNTPIRFVLVETSHPGNIGAAARAMKNMSQQDLYLVKPAHFPHADATARASGADDLLAQSVVVDSLDEAIADCRLVMGTSARLRSLPWPLVEPRECASRLVAEAESGPVAIVFGRERTGLTNDELASCQALVHIPTNDAYSSLNVAAAVQILAYEIHLAQRGEQPGPTMPHDSPLATQQELLGLYEHLESMLIDIDFLDPVNPGQLMRRLRRLYSRVELEQNEVNILRGICTAVEKRSR